MTTIAALRHAGTLYLAADTRSVDNLGRVQPLAGSKLLILKTPDVPAGSGLTSGSRRPPFVVGHTGGRMVRPILTHHVALEHPGGGVTDAALDEWAQGYAERLAEACRDRNVPREQDGLIDHAQLVAHRGRLWYLTDGLADRVDTDVAAIGSGGDVALGYLTALVDAYDDGRAGLTPPHYDREDAVVDAVRAASRHDTGTGGEVHAVTISADGTVNDLGMWEATR